MTRVLLPFATLVVLAVITIVAPTIFTFAFTFTAVGVVFISSAADGDRVLTTLSGATLVILAWWLREFLA